MNATPASYTCPKCDRVSYHPKDVENHYCGFCHVFLDDLRNETVTDFAHITKLHLTRKDCWTLALLTLADSRNDAALLVHAWVDKTITGKPEQHAWCEMPATATYEDGGTGEIIVVIDYTQPHAPSRIIPQELAYREMGARDLKRYTLAQATAIATPPARMSRYGPAISMSTPGSPSTRASTPTRMRNRRRSRTGRTYQKDRRRER